MFMTSGLAIYLIALEFILGAVVGLVVAGRVYRSRFRLGLLIRAAVLGGVFFVFAVGVAGWADSETYFYNGQRLDVAPDGKSLWLRNRIAEHELSLAVLSSCSAALLAGLRFQRGVHR